MRLTDWVALLRLARRRLASVGDYTRFEVFQGQLVLSGIQSKGYTLGYRRTLDLGCGYGGYSYAMASITDCVVGVDRYLPPGRYSAAPVRWVRADALALPFQDGEFDLIICASLIEHTVDPKRLLEEIRRVMAPRALCYLSFPPFYSPVGGHQFKPFHLLGERVAIRLSRMRCKGYATACGQWGLHPRTIRQVKRLIGEAGLTILRMSTRFLPVNTAALPIVGEFLTWHVEFILSGPCHDPA